MICIRAVDKMTVEDIGDYIKNKTSKMKKSGGGEEHKKQTGWLRLVPACIIAIIIEVMSFVTNRLGISLPALKVEKHAFGAGCVTSIGSLGFEDAVAPFTGFANCSVLLSVNAISEQPVVEDGKIVVGKVMNCNFVVDHRYIDGGNCTKLVSTFKHIFEEPEKYMNSAK
jgi:hypothetical protein